MIEIAAHLRTEEEKEKTNKYFVMDSVKNDFKYK